MIKRIIKKFSIAAISICVVTFNSCEPELIGGGDSSFKQIQTKIFDTSCALSGCHGSKDDASFAQHGLILTAGQAHKNLVNREPVNEHARHLGLKLVDPGDGENSFLLGKLQCQQAGHSHEYGTMMPLGRDPLPEGQIRYIEAWINQGAPKNGFIDADVNLLEDNVPACAEEFTPLAAPQSGTGYQIKIEPFDIKPNFEREIFVYKDLGNEEAFFTNKIEMKMRRNSHHFLINTFEQKTPAYILPALDVVRELRDGNGVYVFSTIQQMEYQQFTIASQTPALNYDFPKGVALKMQAHQQLDVNLHYVNKSASTIQGECYVNIYKADPAEVMYEAQPLFYSHENFTLPQGEKTIVVREFKTARTMQIFMLTSHTHKLGERFEIQITGGARNGEKIYTSSDWHHPATKTYDPPIALQPGEGLAMIVTYNNNTDKTVKFGLKSDDEMAIIFGYYY